MVALSAVSSLSSAADSVTRFNCIQSAAVNPIADGAAVMSASPLRDGEIVTVSPASGCDARRSA